MDAGHHCAARGLDPSLLLFLECSMRDDLAKVLMLGLLFGAVSPQKQKTWKQKFSTLLGLMMLSFIVVLILTMGMIRWASFNEVRGQINILTQKVAHLDHAALMNWAAGNEKDCWGNTFEKQPEESLLSKAYQKYKSWREKDAK